ncbi:MAG: hypothetical protein ABWZ42_02065, partial [Ilumatobacteraceae bacterium]
RRSQLLAIKLRALVAEHVGRAVDDLPQPVAGGSAVVVDGAAWFLVDGDARRALGGAIAWAIRHGASSLDLIAESATGLLARRAERFAFPVTVWYPVDRSLLPAVAEPLPVEPAASPAHLDVRGVIEASGATLVVEHGVVTGEVRGLEVCRVVDQPTTGYFDEDGVVGEWGEQISALGNALAAQRGGASGVMVEVGVGGPDREAFRIIHGDLPTVDALAEVVATVAGHRAAGAPPHPLNRLVPERLLRSRLAAAPELIGLRRIEPVAPPLPRQGLNEVAPCVATGIDDVGETCRVVCSVGVDIDLIPFVADVQATSADAIVVVLPSRDLVPITRDLAALLRIPVTLATVD